MPSAHFPSRATAWALILFSAACGAAPQETAPQGRPQTIPVHQGDNLQAAINRAQPGDTILLDNGAVFTTNIVLPPKTGEGWIEIRPVSMTDLPPEGVRVTPDFAKAMPKIISPNIDPAVSANGPAHHYRFIGLEMGVVSGTWHWATVSMGTDHEQQVSDYAHDLEFDRVYVHGDPKFGSVRGFALNGGNIVVKNSYISDYKRPDLDTQAIAIWNSPGHIQILNNYLEAAAENILLGGATPAIRNMVPSDVEIRFNYFRKPLSWMQGDPSYEGTLWSVKNLFEVKLGQRIVFDSNVLENVWQQSQIGFAIVLTVRTENGVVDQGVVEDVTITNNTIRHAGCGVNFLGVDDAGQGAGRGQTRRVTIHNNLFYDIGGKWGGGGRLFQLLSGTQNVTIDHNTVFRSNGSILVAAGTPHVGFQFTNNLVSYGDYGVVGDGISNGVPVLDAYFPGNVFRNNGIVGTQPNLRPAQNVFLDSYDDVRFVDSAGLDFRLALNSPLRNKASDGTDIGANIAAVQQATSGASTLAPPASTAPHRR